MPATTASGSDSTWPRATGTKATAMRMAPAAMATMRDVSRVPQVNSAVDRLRSVGIRVLGTVVNGVSDSAPRRLYASPAPV